ncbi:SDR family oxidoreductase [uncultured Eudoraea sp.]|jgi:NAD(P)-dependent dehydrogenase (short-subunit alcohol dehydrogenase family)|uniref:SDR family oxidoreductase n=1 Tax=uncultured Eudoraea sp. TaxID=1035614 RepID=UPI002602FD23|nr:SDR family oxidoreductase [uncultured Eudoraea sp.]
MSELFSVDDKIIVISGATGVLGSAMTAYLAEQGARVVALGRNPDKINALIAENKGNRHKVFPLIADVTNERDLERAKLELENEFGKIDVLVNLAGGNMAGAVITPEQTILDARIDELNKVMELNYLGSFLPIKTFLPLFLKDLKGSIINISSMAAQRPITRVLGYGSAKAAIDNLTKWLAIEFCSKHSADLRVNAIAPGFFLTEQNRTLLTETDGKLTKRGRQIIENTPMGRFGNPDELFGVLQWLSSDASKFVTGTIIPVDGGFNAYSGV